MTFGQWLTSQRSKQGYTQADLSKMTGLSVSYISALERDEPNARDGSPRRPRVEKVDRIAKALSVPIGEARLAAGYSAGSEPSKPKTMVELLDRLAALGIENIHFANNDAYRNASPEELQDLLDAVEIAIDVTLTRHKRKHVPTPLDSAGLP